MPARRKAAAAAALGIVPLALTALGATPAAAHGSMGDPVSRVAQCYAEGPESPRSDACEAAVAAGGTQALYDWNGIRIGNAAGQHQALIPDGKLCSANNEEFKGLDLARADWPATSVSSGSYTFKYRVTAPHRGTFTVYLTKPGYDPSQPLAWADLDLANPVATVTDPTATGGFYTFSGTLPERSGQHLLYAVWQRSDSPEAFYSCSDVTFGAAAPAAPAPAASAPSDEQVEAATERSTVENHGHGDDDPETTSDVAEGTTANEPRAAGSTASLAETGGDGTTPYLAVGGAAALAVGAAALFASVRRRAVDGGRHGR
ncbi:lytic polysaccharide monooxygenase auxiliary activity family 9 protein [Streptomyces flavalbus]|uniref:Lytic polysaccharide monooxygenase n=1 Tax=Streptomyces flavalbus TaxID=2665155 RepID=A0ABW2W3F4_9ACTN